MTDADKMDEMRKRVITIALSSILPPVFLVFLLGALFHRRSTRKQRYLLSEVRHSKFQISCHIPPNNGIFTSRANER